MNVNCWPLLAEKLKSDDARLFGRELNRIGSKDLGLLERAQVLRAGRPRESLGSCPCDMHDCTRVVERFDGKVFAACPNAMWPLEEIEEKSLRVFHINEQEFLRQFARANDLQGEVEPLNRFVVHVGTRELPGESVLVVLARELWASTLAETRGLLFGIFGTRPAVILTPVKARLSEAEVALLTTERRQLVALSPALEAASGSLRIAWPTSAPAAFAKPAASPEPRLVLRTESKVATLDGVRLALQAQPFELLRYLALRATPDLLPIPTSTIYQEVWQVVAAKDVPFFESVVDSNVSKIRSAFREVVPAEEKRLLFNQKGKGYGLGLPPDQIEIA